MTNQKTPVQGGATEEQIEAAARASYDEWRSPDYFTWEQAVEGRNANPDPTFPHIVDKFRAHAKAALIAAFTVQEPSEERKLMQSLAKWVGVPEDAPLLEIACEVSGVLEDALAARSVSVSSDPAEEHHDAEEQQAAKLTPGAFFEVTGTVDEIFKIVDGINSHEGRETSGDSASLDLWQEMLGEWMARVRQLGHVESEDHAATLTGGVGEHARDHMGICRNCGAGLSAMDILDGELPCEATVTGDREKLIAEAERLVRQSAAGGNPVAEFGVTKEIAFVRGVRFAAAALAAPVEVDEAKLAELALRFCTCSHWLEEHFERECIAHHCACRDFDPVLRGEGR
ncbi:hypothetical protein ACFWHR_03985 [Leucobacter sp. NPDC058333]|uniref:hypothetical protein n=1 Tax=Leucobacter sp. NPDC058333 TaxID=3346450 RepID=UPI0036671D6D